MARHRIGIEHHRKAIAVGNAGEQRDDFLVAFQRMNVDGAAAAKPRQACVADEILDAWFREHVGQFLLGHSHRLVSRAA